MKLGVSFSRWIPSLISKKSRARRRAVVPTAGEQFEIRQVLSATSIVAATSSSVLHFRYDPMMGAFGPVTNNTMISLDSRNSGVGDLNGDGHEDLVQMTRGSGVNSGFGMMPATLKVALNDGNGQYFNWQIWDSNVPLSPSSGGSTWTDLKVGDFTGDGRADVLARDKETGQWSLWTSSGWGFTKSTFGTWDVGVQWRDTVTGDFNGDGLMDIAGRRVPNDAPGIPAPLVDDWFVGLGSSFPTDRGVVGSWGSSWWLLTSTPHLGVVANAVVGNFDGDAGHRDDLAIRFALNTTSIGSRGSEWDIAYTGAVGVTVPLTQMWSGNWDHALSGGIQQHWRDLQAGDVNGDGLDDILGRTKGGQWYASFGGTPATDPAVLVANWTSSDTTVAGDFDGDQKLDLVQVQGGQLLRSTYVGSAYTAPAPAGGNGNYSMPVRKLTFVGGNAAGYSTYRGHEGNLGASSALALLEDVVRWNGGNGAEVFEGGESTSGGGGGMGGWPGTGSTGGMGSYSGSSGGSSYGSDYMGMMGGTTGGMTGGTTGGSSSSWGWGGTLSGNDPFYAVGRYNADGTFDFEDFGGGLTGSSQFGVGNGSNFYRGDFTGDGLQDILSKGIDPSQPNNWYLGTNRGNAYVNSLVTAIPQSWSGSDYQKFHVGDFTGDGKADLLIQAAYINPGVSASAIWTLYVSTGTGFASGVVVATPSNVGPNATNWIAGGSIGDFNNDGKDDLVYESAAVNQSDPSQTVYNVDVAYSNGAAPWSIGTAFIRIDSMAMGGTRLFFIENHGDRERVGDVNGDGYDDVLLLQNLNSGFMSTGQIVVGYFGPAAGVVAYNLPAPFDFSAPKDRHIFEVGRFVGGDLCADVVINPSDNTNLMRVYGGGITGLNTSVPALTGPLGTYGLLRPVVADTDRDGNDDLVWGSTGYSLSLMVNSNSANVATPNDGFYPGNTADWYGYVTTLPRLRRRRG